MNMKFLAVLAGLVAFSSGCVPGLGGGSSSSSGSESLSQQVARHDQQLNQILPGQAESWSQIQTMRQDLTQLQGKVDEVQRGGGGGGDEVARLRERVDKQEALLRQISSQLAINAGSLDASSGSSSSASVSSSSSSGTVDTATALYDQGIKAFDQRKYKDAVVAFRDFGASYPKHKRAPDAHFYEGESYFEMNDYPRAALAYQDVIEKFPGSAKVQPAMLKQGVALQKAGKKDAARERLSELVKRYPSSPEASRAKQIIASLK